MKRFPITVSIILVFVGHLSTTLAQHASPTSLTVRTAQGDHVALEVAVQDTAPANVAAACALVVAIDGRESQHILLTPGSGRTAYDALLGPFEPGEHTIALTRSPLWSWPGGIDIARTNARVIHAAGADDQVVSRAPSLGIRADTIGTASDLPLLVYAEDTRVNGKGWIRYSAILSNEDGGTPPPALMARWGRTTDIELIYEIELDGTRVVQERFQGPDHQMRAVRGPREGFHPYLLVATLNNMVIDRGRSLAMVRPVPYLVSLDGRTRESVMDDHTWTYRVMARELVAENRIGTEVEDPREFLYVEAELKLENAAISVQAGSESGGWKDSNRGRYDLAVNRNGWVRIALPVAPTASNLRWNCQTASNAPGKTSVCTVRWTRAFRLGDDYLPGPNLIDPGSVSFGPGLSNAVPLRSK